MFGALWVQSLLVAEGAVIAWIVGKGREAVRRKSSKSVRAALGGVQRLIVLHKILKKAFACLEEDHDHTENTGIDRKQGNEIRGGWRARTRDSG